MTAVERPGEDGKRGKLANKKGTASQGNISLIQDS